MKAILNESRPAYKQSFDSSRGYKFIHAGEEISVVGYNEISDRFTGMTADGWTVNFDAEQATPIE